jgi:hypothetical protein
MKYYRTPQKFMANLSSISYNIIYRTVSYFGGYYTKCVNTVPSQSKYIFRYMRLGNNINPLTVSVFRLFENKGEN